MNLQNILARLKTATSSLSSSQLVTLAVTFVAVVALVVGSAYWVNAPTYAVLFSDMEPESASSVSAKLKTDKVVFTLEDGGRTIRVPAERVDELRLAFASQGMPTSGRIGFEIFDRTAFGVTDFLEHVNYRRALEGELARTISTIGEVASARVHIAMPKSSLFAGQDQPAKASVVLKLRSTRPLAPSTTAAISGLVAAAVESLRPESVVIIDTFGHPLTRPAEDGSGGGMMQAERQQQIERELSARVVSLIDPIVGAERVRVNVSARLHADSQEETEERWDPTPIVRSRQSVSQGSAATGAAEGIAGSRSNLPTATEAPAKPDAPAKPASSPLLAAATGPTHTAETTNYEVSKMTRHRIQPRGEIAKLSVAVLLDGAPKPRSPEELQKIHDVVAAAVGFEEERGDQLTVETVAFEEPAAVPETVVLPWWKKYAPLLLDAGRIVSVLVIGLVVIFAVIRPTLRRAFGALPARGAAPGPARQLPKTVAQMEGEMDAEIDAALDQPGQPRRLPALTRRVAKLTQEEPENAARLVRSWLAEEER